MKEEITQLVIIQHSVIACVFVSQKERKISGIRPGRVLSTVEIVFSFAPWMHSRTSVFWHCNITSDVTTTRKRGHFDKIDLKQLLPTYYAMHINYRNLNIFVLCQTEI